MTTNPFTQQLKASKVPSTKTSVDSKPSKPAPQNNKGQSDSSSTYSEEDLKSVVVLSVKLPAVVRQAIRRQCAEQDIKLATEAKKWLIERFELPEGFTAETILEDKRTK